MMRGILLVIAALLLCLRSCDCFNIPAGANLTGIFEQTGDETSFFLAEGTYYIYSPIVITSPNIYITCNRRAVIYCASDKIDGIQITANYNVSIVGVTITSCSTAISLNSATQIFISTTTITGNNFGVKANSSSAFITNTLVSLNDANGAEVISTTLYLSGTRFISNGGATTHQGGGIKALDSSITGDFLIFQNNTAYFGGAVYASSSDLSFSWSSITSNKALGSGGAFHIRDSEKKGNVSFYYSTFTSNTANLDGGAFDIVNSSSSFTSTIFSRNVAILGSGGAIMISSSSFSNYTNCNFTLNNGRDGGAIYASEISAFLYENGTLTQNKAFTAGAIYLANSTATIQHASFTTNRGNYSFGGAVYLFGTSATLQSINCTANFAPAGGCIAVSLGSNLRLLSSEIQVNTGARAGGGVFSNGGNITVMFTSISDNTGTGGDSNEVIQEVYGSGICAYNGAYVNISDSSITGNVGTNGGGIYAETAYVTIFSTLVGSNLAARGGGIHTNASELFFISNSTIARNVAHQSGGGIYTALTELEITISVLSSNRAGTGGAIFSSDEAFTLIVDSSIINNTAATQNPGIYVPDPFSNLFHVQNSLVEDSGRILKYCCSSAVKTDIYPAELCNFPACDFGCTEANGCNCPYNGPPSSPFYPIMSQVNVTCTCISGFKGGLCEVNSSVPDCSCEAGTCTPSGCVCNPGYEAFDDERCIDVDECSTQSDSCSIYAQCINGAGTFSCICLNGLTGDGFNCYDLDECALGTSNCYENETCINVWGSYNCACAPGYYAVNGSCIDENECLTNVCGDYAKCTNIPGSYECQCLPGFSGSSPYCYDIDECSLNAAACGEHAYCNNTIGSYNCVCLAGYIPLDTYSCIDFDECSVHNGGCDIRATCINNIGGFSCGPCSTGFIGDGYSGCVSLCQDSICESSQGENCLSCTSDCQNATCGICGDGECNMGHGETCSNCFEDCGACDINGCTGGCGTGKCASDQCICYGSYSGPTCGSTTQTMTLGLNLSRPVIDVKTSALTRGHFVISLGQIQERSSDGSTISDAQFTFSDYNFSLTGQAGDPSVYTYSTTLPNQAKVVLLITQIMDKVPVEFTTPKVGYSQNTLATKLQVYNWPFARITNSLAVYFSMDAKDTSTKCIHYANDESGSVSWRMLNVVPDVTLYHDTIATGTVDSRTRILNYSLSENDTNSLVVQFPHFWFQAETTTKYNVLLGETNTGACASINTGTTTMSTTTASSSSVEEEGKGEEEEKKRERKRKRALVAIYVVIPVVFGLIFAAGIFVVAFPRLQLFWQRWRIERKQMKQRSIEMDTR